MLFFLRDPNTAAPNPKNHYRKKAANSSCLSPASFLACFFRRSLHARSLACSPPAFFSLCSPSLSPPLALSTSKFARNRYARNVSENPPHRESSSRGWNAARSREIAAMRRGKSANVYVRKHQRIKLISEIVRGRVALLPLSFSRSDRLTFRLCVYVRGWRRLD